MRYTQTELDKIMMIGFGSIDNAVERVIASYEAPQLDVPVPDTYSIREHLVSAEAFLRYLSGLQNNRIGTTLCAFGQSAYQGNALYGPQSMAQGFF